MTNIKKLTRKVAYILRADKKKDMKTIHLVLSAFLILTLSCSAEAQLLKDAKKLLNQNQKGSFTENEAVQGIREALIKGTGTGVDLVSLTDGYFGNPLIRIPFPDDAKMVESRLRSMGLGKQVDEAILSFNRAAEDAAKQAKPIFTGAIREMTIQDAIGIVKGPEDAATAYLRKTTTTRLATEFKPVIKTSLDRVNATKYWTDLINTYNKIPLVQKVNPDLSEYVTSRAIEGLFMMIAAEEKKIRKDPVARTSEILKKVFGN